MSVVVGGRVDVEVAVVADEGGFVEVVVDGAACAGAGLPNGRLGAGHMQEALSGAAVGGLEEGIGGIDEIRAVHGEGVGVDIGLERVGGGGPDALLVLLHGEALADAGDGDLFGVGGAEAEGDFAVGRDFGGADGRGAAAGLGGEGGGGEGDQDGGSHSPPGL